MNGRFVEIRVPTAFGHIPIVVDSTVPQGTIEVRASYGSTQADVVTITNINTDPAAYPRRPREALYWSEVEDHLDTILADAVDEMRDAAHTAMIDAKHKIRKVFPQ